MVNGVNKGANEAEEGAPNDYPALAGEKETEFPRTQPMMTVFNVSLWLLVIICAAAIPSGMLIAFAIVVLALIFYRSTRAPTLSFVYRNWAWSIGIGLVVGVGSAFTIDPMVEQFATWATGERVDLSALAGVEGNTNAYLQLLAVALIFGGVIEEVINRGFLIGWGSSFLGARSALPLVLLTAIAFGLAHMWQGPSGMILTGVGGLVLGLVYYFCDRKLLPCIVAHASGNFVGTTQIYLYGVA